MKKLIKSLCFYFTLVALSFSSQAIDSLRLEGFELDYNETKGGLSGDSLEVEHKEFNFSISEQSLELIKENDRFHIITEKAKFNFPIQKESLLNTSTLVKLHNLNLDTQKGKYLAGGFSEGSFLMGAGVQKLHYLQISCQAFDDREEEDLLDSFIEPCLDHGSLKLGQFSLAKGSQRTFASAVSNRAINFDSVVPSKFKNFRLSVAAGKFYMQLSTKVFVNLTLKMSGYLSYQKDENKLTLTVRSAKAGWFSIRSKVLKALRDAKFENVKVHQNKIIIQL